MTSQFRKAFAVAVLAGFLCVFAHAGEKERRRAPKRSTPLSITAVPWGPTQADVDNARIRAEQSAALQKYVSGTKFRFLAIEYIEPEGMVRIPPTLFRATFYSYTKNLTYIAEGDFAGRQPITVREIFFQPAVSENELQAAQELLKSDAELGRGFTSGELEVAPAMPPITMGGADRLVNLSVRNRRTNEFRIVGINFRTDTIVKYEGGAPELARSSPEACGIPNAGQATTNNGTAGQAVITISDGSPTPLWEMLVIRPSASSGNSGERSGIEIRDVKYKGKLLMKRGHLPVLNVEYAGNACGPYRDWQWQEGAFAAADAGATDPAPGVRILANGQIATTSLETGNDTGNFRGVAIYRQTTEYGQEVVMVSEMNAGWYRYLMEWRFAPDGTIRPRYGFGATNNSCVCALHIHHAYWRFDFDVVNANNRVFQVERGRKFRTPILTELKRLRNYQTNRGFIVQNANGNEAVQIVPNLFDGVADTFGKGDFWILKFQGTPSAPLELDDLGDFFQTEMNIEPWVNGESIDNQDVVVWYGAHFTHNDTAAPINPSRNPQVLGNSHVVGPEIRLIQW